MPRPPSSKPIPGFDSDDEIRPTENAVRTVLDRGLFVREADREFDFLVYSSSVGELRDYFAMVGGCDEGPSSPRIVYLRDQLYRRAQEALDPQARRRPRGLSGAGPDLPIPPLMMRAAKSPGPAMCSS